MTCGPLLTAGGGRQWQAIAPRHQLLAAGVGVAFGLGFGLSGVVPTAFAAPSAENDMDNYMKVLTALQSRLDSMSTK